MYEDELRDRFIEWKKQWKLSFDDLAILFNASKGHLFKFSKGRVGLGYELGKQMEHCIESWNKSKNIELKARRYETL